MITIYTELVLTAILLLLIAVITPKLFGIDSIIVALFAVILDGVATIIIIFVLIHKILTLIS